MAQLTCEASQGGGGGTSCFQCSDGAGAPVAAPENPDQPASYHDTTSNFTYNWDVPTQQWIPVPKVYRALLSQTGTDAPVADVKINTLGAAVWSYEGVGDYRMTLAGAFPASKIYSSFMGTETCISKPAADDVWIILNYGNIDYISLNCTTFGVPGDGYIQNTAFEILVYP